MLAKRILKEDFKNYKYWRMMEGRPILQSTASLSILMPTPIKEEPDEPFGSNYLDNQPVIHRNTESMEDEEPSELEKLLVAKAPAKPKKYMGLAPMLYPGYSIGVQCKPKTAEKSTNYIARKIGPLRRLVPKYTPVADSVAPSSPAKGSTNVEEDYGRCKECGWALKGYQLVVLKVFCGSVRAAHRTNLVLRVALGKKQPLEAIAVINQHLVNDFQLNYYDDEVDKDREDDTVEPLEDYQQPEDSSDESDESGQSQHSRGSDYTPSQSDVDSQDSEHRDLSDAEDSKVRPPRRKRSRIQAINRKKDTRKQKNNNTPQRPSTSEQDLGTAKQKNVYIQKVKQMKVLKHSKDSEGNTDTNRDQKTDITKNRDQNRTHMDNIISEPTRSLETVANLEDDDDYENVEYLSDIEELT